jgi:hypothetical protein
LTDLIADAERELARGAGGFLRNIVREPGVTCSVCATAVDGYPWCWSCRQARSTPGLADLVVPLTYAIQGTQSATVLRHYKDNPTLSVRAQHARIVNRLLYLGIMLHEQCIEQKVGRPVTLRLAVPSLRGRPGTHPFIATARTMRAVNDAPQLVPTAGADHDRTVSANQFALGPDVSLRGHHILILDDTWTTGANAQSAALTVRHAGAEAVSVVVVGRWLVPGFANNAEFIRRRLRGDYDPHLCPVTGGDCPR